MGESAGKHRDPTRTILSPDSELHLTCSPCSGSAVLSRRDQALGKGINGERLDDWDIITPDEHALTMSDRRLPAPMGSCAKRPCRSFEEGAQPSYSRLGLLLVFCRCGPRLLRRITFAQTDHVIPTQIKRPRAPISTPPQPAM